MRNASGHNYWNSSFIIDVAMGQIPRSAERISSLFVNLYFMYDVTESQNTVYHISLVVINSSLDSGIWIEPTFYSAH